MKQQNRMAQEKTQIGYTDSLSSVRGLKPRLVGSILTVLILLAGIGVPRAFAAELVSSATNPAPTASVAADTNAPANNVQTSPYDAGGWQAALINGIKTTLPRS
ncbi:hypothetical protein LQE88_08620 [Acidaminococcus sp. NSJ-142]|jgi:hypothetical protein|uniref:hypothetical protein n=1 Tax=Acidaminococcus TaxID=904 RepID=UPI001E2E7D65|nr:MULTISPECIES: hypothetical protein [Acidaminococcus]MCD2436044.1 hypothetical protein [Acidaminococcus hominis]